MVERECVQADTRSVERRYFISSIAAQAKGFAHAVQGHWGVENPLHWRLDVYWVMMRAAFGKETHPR